MSESEPGLAAVLERASAELLDLSVVTDRLTASAGVAVEQWQALDRITQHLAELSEFLSAVSRLVPDVRAELAAPLAAIRVSALANRLAVRPAAVPADTGTLELFEA